MSGRTKEDASQDGRGTRTLSMVRQLGFMAFYLVLAGKYLDTFRLIN